MKSNPSRPGAPARPAASRPQAPRSGATTAQRAQRAANVQNTRAFVQGVVSELKRVTWPTREEWVAATILTIALVVGVGVFTYVCDLVFGYLFGWLTGGAR